MNDVTSFVGPTPSSTAPVGPLSLFKRMELGLEGGGGVLDHVVMERKKQEEGFADRIAVTSALKNVCVLESECVSVSEKKKSGIRREEDGQSSHSALFLEDQSSIHIKHVFRSVGNSGAHFAVCLFFINPLF